jgi:hypothetical protein
VQVKRSQDRPVEWREVEHHYRNAGDAHFCFVSVFGFTQEAVQMADAEGIRLLEVGDFVHFLLGGKLRPQLKEKHAFRSGVHDPWANSVNTAMPRCKLGHLT